MARRPGGHWAGLHIYQYLAFVRPARFIGPLCGRVIGQLSLSLSLSLSVSLSLSLSLCHLPPPQLEQKCAREKERGKYWNLGEGGVEDEEDGLARRGEGRVWEACERTKEGDESERGREG